MEEQISGLEWPSLGPQQEKPHLFSFLTKVTKDAIFWRKMRPFLLRVILDQRFAPPSWDRLESRHWIHSNPGVYHNSNQPLFCKDLCKDGLQRGSIVPIKRHFLIPIKVCCRSAVWNTWIIWLTGRLFSLRRILTRKQNFSSRLPTPAPPTLSIVVSPNLLPKLYRVRFQGCVPRSKQGFSCQNLDLDWYMLCTQMVVLLSLA